MIISTLIFAAALRIRLVYIPSDDGITQAEFQELAKDLTSYLQRQVSPRIRITRRTLDIPRPTNLSVDDANNEFRILHQFHDSTFAMSHYIFGPVWVQRGDGNYPYLMGYTFRACTKAPYTDSYSTAYFENIDGYPRYWESVTGAAHEIGHQLGAKHSSSGLMRYLVLAYAHEGIPAPSGGTRREWRRCGKI